MFLPRVADPGELCASRTAAQTGPFLPAHIQLFGPAQLFVKTCCFIVNSARIIGSYE